MPRASLLLALLGSSAALTFLGCFDDKHDKYPDPADPNRPLVVAGRDPSASQSGSVPGYDPAATSSRWGTGGVDTSVGPGGSASSSASAPPASASASASSAPAGSGKPKGAPRSH
jgi:hypothetical protein